MSNSQMSNNELADKMYRIVKQYHKNAHHLLEAFNKLNEKYENMYAGAAERQKYNAAVLDSMLQEIEAAIKEETE